MSDSDSSGLSSARSDILADPVLTTGSTANGMKKRKRANTQAAPASAQGKRVRIHSTTQGKQEDGTEADLEGTPKLAKASPRGKKKAKIEGKEEVRIEVTSSVAIDTSKKGKRSTKDKVKVEEETGVDGEVKVKVKRKRKTKEEKEAESMPLAARTLGAKVLVGAHVSSAGGVHNAVVNSIYIGGNAFALFLKSQRKWENPPLQEEHLTGFISRCKEHKYGHDDNDIPPIVPHGSYVSSYPSTETSSDLC